MVAHGQLLGINVAVDDAHYPGRSLHAEGHVVGGRLHAPSLAVEGLDAHVLQVHAVGLPLAVVGLGPHLLGLTGGFYAMAGHNLAVLTGNSLQIALLIVNVVPANLVAHLCVAHGVLLSAQAPAVEQQLHLVGVGIGDELHLRAFGPVPVVAHAVVARLNTIPHHVALLVDDGDVNHRLVGQEEAPHVVSLWLRLQTDVEHALRPSLGGPSLALAQIVDGTPIGQSDDLVEIHLEIVLSHGRDGSLALVERHPGEAPSVAGEVHVAIVIGLHVGNHSQVAGQRVGLPVAIARMHGHRHQSGAVVALHQRLHQPVHGHAEVVVGLVGILLQLVSQAPHHHRGRVAVALHPFGHVLLPQGLEGLSAASVLARPLVIQLVDHQHAIFVAQLNEAAAIGVVAGAYVVHAPLLHHHDALLHGAVVGSSTQRPKRVVVGIALEQHLPSVELQAIVGAYLDGAQAKALSGHVHCHALLVL